MKAIILSGGMGKRFKPVTCTVPKALVKVVGKPMIEYSLDLLKKHGYTECTLALCDKAEKIHAYFEEESYNGTALKFSKEQKALGTAGAIKYADYSDEEALVLSADNICDFDLKAMEDFHRKMNSDITIAVKQVDDIREKALMLYTDDGKAIGFLNRPSYESYITDKAVCGTYILSPKALELINLDEVSDLEKDIFPKALKDGLNVYAYEESGYCCDINNAENYLKCTRDILDGRVDCETKGHRTLEGITICENYDFRGVKISSPCYIGKNVKISSGTVINAYSVIGDGVNIGKGSKIHSSVIMNSAFLGENVTCNEAIICENAKLLNNSSVYENCIVGAGAVIGESAEIQSRVKIWTGKELSSNTTAVYNVKYGTAKPFYIEDDGICGETNAEITPQICSFIGSGVGSLALENKNPMPVLVGYRGTHSSKSFAMSVMSGILSSGADVWNLGECFETELIFAMKQSGIKYACMIDCGVMAKIRFFGENGLPLKRKEEIRIEDAVNNADFSTALFSSFGGIQGVQALKGLYANHLRRTIGTKLHGFNVSVNSANQRVKDICEKVLSGINDREGEHIIFHISSDGKKLSAYSDKTGYVFYDKLILLGCKFAMQRGYNVALPFSAPRTADNIAEKFGKEIKRYYHCPVDESDSEARLSASETTFPRDALMLMCLILNTLSEEGNTLQNAVLALPKFTSISRFVAISKSPAEILKGVCKENCGNTEGIMNSDENSRVIIRPVKTGKGLMMYVESFMAETASELCDFYEKLIEEKLG